MKEYFVDDSVDEISWSSVINVEHLDSDLTYEKYLNEINSTLGPECTLSLSLDYESMKLLLKQAKEYNIPFINSNELTAIFIIKNINSNVARRLLIEEGYLDEKKVAGITDPCVYKKILKLLEEEKDIDYIKEVRKKYVDTLFNNSKLIINLVLFSKKYMFDTSYFFDEKYNKLNEFDSAKLFLLDLVAETIFDDYFINVQLDVKQILKYTKLTNTNVISKERLDFYKRFSSLDELDLDGIINFYKENKTANLIEIFYDDIRNLKDDSYKSLVDSCTKFTKDSPLYNEDLSNKYGCEIYYLDGEEFFGFVRSDIKIEKKRYKFENGNCKEIENEQPTKEQISRLGSSFTYIGKDDIQTYKHPNENLTMLYRGIDYRNIGHVYHNDSWSSSEYSNFSDYQNELHTPNSLLQESTKYPEIFINDLNGIEPFALICFDKPTNWDIEFSKRNNMPIVVINTLKYERKYAPENYTENHYKR